MNSATPRVSESMIPAGMTREVSGEPEEIASAVNSVHSTHSSGREKVLEHIFLGDLLRALWRMGVHDTQVLRPEVDRNGYEFMLGHERIRRSVQLKSTYRGGNVFAHLINGYRLAQREGFGDLQDFYWTSLAEAERTGIWSGTTLELWLALFAAHRANRHGGWEPEGEYRRQLDELCHTLRQRLAEGVSHQPRD
jgi:hypothetical protein